MLPLKMQISVLCMKKYGQSNFLYRILLLLNNAIMQSTAKCVFIVIMSKIIFV